MQKSRFSLLVVLGTQLCCLAFAADDGPEMNRILKLFPGYHVLSMSERDSETRTFLLQHLPKRNPSVIHADIDGDGYPDYALLLRQDKPQSSRFVVLLCPKDGPCRKTYELDVTGYSDGAYLTTAPPEKTIDLPATQQIVASDKAGSSQGAQVTGNTKPAQTGIFVTYFGKGQILLRWSRKAKKLVEVPTRD